jgi:hypothetical protein
MCKMEIKKDKRSIIIIFKEINIKYIIKRVFMITKLLKKYFYQLIQFY